MEMAAAWEECMISEIVYETHHELVYPENATYIKDLMTMAGWTCSGEKVIDSATGRLQLEFRRAKE